jgi:hypothetical protein
LNVVLGLRKWNDNLGINEEVPKLIRVRSKSNTRNVNLKLTEPQNSGNDVRVELLGNEDDPLLLIEISGFSVDELLNPDLGIISIGSEVLSEVVVDIVLRGNYSAIHGLCLSCQNRTGQAQYAHGHVESAITRRDTRRFPTR